MMNRLTFFAILTLLTTSLYGQGIVVNADGTHSIVTGNIVVNPDGTHSVIAGSVLVNPDGTHSIIAGSTVISPNGTTGTLLNSAETSVDNSVFAKWNSWKKRRKDLKESHENSRADKRKNPDERQILTPENFQWLKTVVATHY